MTVGTWTTPDVLDLVETGCYCCGVIATDCWREFDRIVWFCRDCRAEMSRRRR